MPMSWSREHPLRRQNVCLWGGGGWVGGGGGGGGGGRGLAYESQKRKAHTIISNKNS